MTEQEIIELNKKIIEVYGTPPEPGINGKYFWFTGGTDLVNDPLQINFRLEYNNPEINVQFRSGETEKKSVHDFTRGELLDKLERARVPYPQWWRTGRRD